MENDFLILYKLQGLLSHINVNCAMWEEILPSEPRQQHDNPVTKRFVANVIFTSFTGKILWIWNRYFKVV
jgi:hypothetical protein